MAFHRMEPAGAERHGREARRVSSLARTNQTPYNSAKICVICGYQMPTVLIEKQTPQITVLTLNRPERRNALTIELLTELNAAIKMTSDQPQERVIILRGAGAAFCCRSARHENRLSRGASWTGRRSGDDFPAPADRRAKHA